VIYLEGQRFSLCKFARNYSTLWTSSSLFLFFIWSKRKDALLILELVLRFHQFISLVKEYLYHYFHTYNLPLCTFCLNQSVHTQIQSHDSPFSESNSTYICNFIHKFIDLGLLKHFLLASFRIENIVELALFVLPSAFVVGAESQLGKVTRLACCPRRFATSSWCGLLWLLPSRAAWL